MDSRYEAYCLADPVFYDAPTTPRGRGPDFVIAQRRLPEGWQRAEQGDWLAHAPQDSRLPSQGWKIHASGCLHNAEEILAAVWDHCVPRRIAFKFVRSRRLLLLRNGKYADRGSSGKLATIYPADEEQLGRVLRELGEELRGQAGPYILSDLRWGEGPLYVRYGAFAERSRPGDNGELEPAIEDPDGRLVADQRGPRFEVPSWVTLPACLDSHLAARNSTTVEEMPYRIERALHFSNGGGLYAGVERSSGEQVVLKEARPHAGLSADHADAVARLRREREMLERLAGLDVVPAVRGHFTLGDHHFLALEFVEGSSLASLFVDRYPLTAHDPGAATVGEYAVWAMDHVERVERAVEAIHARGVVMGDLHPSNVLVRPDGRVVVIDLEAASLVGEGLRPPLGDPAFVAPPDRAGFDIDRYALACLRLSMFLPLTSLLALEPAKAGQLAAEIGELFPIPEEFLADAVRVIGGSEERRTARIGAEPESWRGACGSMAQAILASATPERDDRLFPGDVGQFSPGGGVNLAHGAAGVLYALDAVGAGRHPEHEEWLLGRALATRHETGLGFYDGLSGVAHTLHRLGRPDDAAKLLDICLDRLAGEHDSLRLDLLGGLSGIGLNLAHFAGATGDPSLWDVAREVADAVADRLGEEHDVAEVSGGDHPHAGLMRGSSGPALLFVRLYEQTGDGALLDLAETALRQDLRRCISTADGGLQVNEGWRTMPYLAEGSAGIGAVLGDYLVHREDERLGQAAEAIRRGSEAPFYAEPGMFQGRAGMIAVLARADSQPAEQVRRLDWHTVTHDGGLAFPGRQLVRLSMDLASGTAGVMLALGAALGEPRAHLPFLGRPATPRQASDDAVILAPERG